MIAKCIRNQTQWWELIKLTIWKYYKVDKQFKTELLGKEVEMVALLDDEWNYIGSYKKDKFELQEW